ncbi:hypothetical protein LOK49_LG02G00321 [Camellia lanceoleosa]|uniref:Uncharacterized protein n=1 Tax=Camellia lanceoleosa TaxID=1840588 RepID=A0ACC0IP64_9ERIC|nr:hypothetical protein LOK49_LG02G00321 [Camellia lanceoleosa]
MMSVSVPRIGKEALIALSQPQPKQWFTVVVAVLCSVGAVVAGAMICFKKFFSNKYTSVPKFQQWSQIQSHGILDDDDEDDNGVDAHNSIHNDHSPL